MKGFGVKVLCLLVFDLCLSKSKDHSFVDTAIQEVVQRYFAENSRKVNLVLCGDQQGFSEQLLEKLLKKKIDAVSFEVI